MPSWGLPLEVSRLRGEMSAMATSSGCLAVSASLRCRAMAGSRTQLSLAGLRGFCGRGCGLMLTTARECAIRVTSRRSMGSLSCSDMVKAVFIMS